MPPTGDLAPESCTWLPLVRSLESYRDVVGNAVDLVVRTVGSESAGIMLFEPESCELVLQPPAFRVADDVARLYRVSLSEGGNAVRVFTSRQWYLSNNCERDPHIIQRYVRLFGARSLVTVPIIVEDKTVGVLHAINKVNGAFSPSDAEMLSTIAAGIGIVVQKSIRIQKINRELEKLEQRVETYRSALAGVIDLSIAFTGCNQDNFLEAAAHRLGLPVAVYDPAGILRVASGDRFPPRLPPSARDMRESDVITVTGADGIAITPIRQMRRSLGYLAVDCYGKPIDEALKYSVLYVSSLIGLLLHNRIKDDPLGELLVHVYSSWVRSISSNDSQVGGGTLSLNLANTLGSRCIAMILLPSGGYQTDDSVTGLIYWHASRVLRSLESKTGYRAIVAVVNDFILVLAELRRDVDPHRLAEQAIDALGVIKEFGAFKVAFTVVSCDLTSLRREIRALSDLARLYRAAGKGSEVIVDLRDIWSVKEIFSLDAETLRSIVTEVLGPIMNLSADDRELLLATVEAYASHAFSVTQTSAALCVHPSTVKYRLARIQQMLGLCLKDSDARFRIALAVRAYRILRAIGGP